MPSQTILIIEDREDIRNMLVSVFTNDGFTVDTAPDGETGLGKAIQGGYAAIILDLKMPHKDGIEFLKEYNKANPPKNGPIVIYSSASYDYARTETLKLGAAAFIIKDEMDTTELSGHVRQLIAAQANQVGSSQPAPTHS